MKEENAQPYSAHAYYLIVGKSAIYATFGTVRKSSRCMKKEASSEGIFPLHKYLVAIQVNLLKTV